MTDVSVTAEMPYIHMDFKADRDLRNLASGVGYVLLKIVQMGQTERGASLTMGQALMLLSVPSDLLPLMVRMLNLFKGTMVEFKGKVTKDTKLSSIAMTQLGSDLLEYGFMAVSDGEAEGSIVIYPGRETKFASGNDVQKSRQGRIKFDPVLQEQAVKYIEEHPSQFCDNPRAVLSNVKFDLRSVDAGYYRQPIGLAFDGEKGDFVLAEKQGIDPAFLAGMDGGDLLRDLPRSLFDMPADIGFKVDRWGSEAPEGTEYILPSELSTGSGLLFYGPQVSHIDQERCTAVKLPDGFGCDAVWVSMGVGYRFWFVKRDISVTGCPGTRSEKLIARRTMNYSESRAMVAEIVGGLDILKSDRKKLQTVASAVRDRDLVPDMAVSALIAGDLERLTEVMKSISRIEDRFWSRSMEEKLGEALRGWISQGTDPRTAAEAFSICRGAGFFLPPDGIAGDIAASLPPAQALDMLQAHFMGAVAAERFVDVPGILVSHVLNPSEGEFVSPLMQKCQTCASAMSAVSSMTGIPTVGDYVLEWSSFDDGTRKEIAAQVRKLNSAYEALAASYGEISKAGSYGDLQRILGIYAAVGTAFSDRKVSDTRRRFAAEKRSLCYCMDLERVLRHVLGRLTGAGGDIAGMLAEAKKDKLADKEACDSLAAFLKFSDKCRHDVLVALPDTKEWTGQVFDLLEKM